MSHINTNPGEHDYTVAAYIVNISNKEPRVVLHKHLRLGKLLPVGGHIERNESISQALIREIYEESGFKLEDLEILQPSESVKSFSDIVAEPQPLSLSIHHHSKANHFHSDIAFAFVTKKEVPGPTEEGESDEFITLTKDELLKLTAEDIFPHTLEMFLYILDTTIKSWERTSAKKRVHARKVLN